MRMKTIKTKKGARWLIILMTLSLIGITGIQAYWISNSYGIKEEKFNQEVGEALSEVSGRLEALDAINFLRNSPVIEPFFSSSSLLQNYERFDSLGRTRKEKEGFHFSMRINGDTTFVINVDSSNLELKGAVSNDSSFRIGFQNLNLKVERRFSSLNRVLERILVQDARRNGKIANRLMMDDLDSLIEFELETKGIDVDFEYAIIENNELAMQSENWNPNNEQHKTALFRGDLFGHRLLLVSFPRKANYLLSSMWFTLLTSMFFTVAMIFTFSKTLSYSLRQKRINDIKTDFINNMTHEFKTPIATINLAIDALNNSKVINNPEKIKHYSTVIKQENNRMNMQVESVLRMALMDKKELELNYEPIIVQDVLEECIDHIKLQLDARGGKAQKFFNDSSIELMADRNHLANTVINILDNAMKYSLGAPDIKIVTEATQNEFIIIISDKGIGMNKEEQKRIFDRFFRVTSGNIHNIKGHGLGLSYVQGIIEAHGGRIEVESEKNKGSKFYIYLPINQKA